MQITLLNSRHNSENFDILFAFLQIFFTKFCGLKNSPVFWTTLYLFATYLIKFTNCAAVVDVDLVAIFVFVYVNYYYYRY